MVSDRYSDGNGNDVIVEEDLVSVMARGIDANLEAQGGCVVG